VEVLDLGDAFAGHEFCARTSQQATPSSFPSSAQAEWGRFLGASSIQQGDVQEVFHPDAYGQQALGSCLTQLYTLSAPGDFRCTDAPGAGPQAMTLARTANFVNPRTFADHPKIAVRGVPRRCARSRWTILRIAVLRSASPRTVKVALGRRTIKRTHAPRFRVAIRAGELKPGRHSIRITVTDSTGARTARAVRVVRCALS
jgi:hypothetical protein